MQNKELKFSLFFTILFLIFDFRGVNAYELNDASQVIADSISKLEKYRPTRDGLLFHYGAEKGSGLLKGLGLKDDIEKGNARIKAGENGEKIIAGIAAKAIVEAVVSTAAEPAIMAACTRPHPLTVVTCPATVVAVSVSSKAAATYAQKSAERYVQDRLDRQISAARDTLSKKKAPQTPHPVAPPPAKKLICGSMEWYASQRNADCVGSGLDSPEFSLSHGLGWKITSIDANYDNPPEVTGECVEMAPDLTGLIQDEVDNHLASGCKIESKIFESTQSATLGYSCALNGDEGKSASSFGNIEISVSEDEIVFNYFSSDSLYGIAVHEIIKYSRCK